MNRAEVTEQQKKERNRFRACFHFRHEARGVNRAIQQAVRLAAQRFPPEKAPVFILGSVQDFL